VSPARPRPPRRAAAPEGPRRVSESLEALSERLGTGAADTLRVVFGRWEQVVGPAMAAHVRPLRLHDGVLVVAVDHPAWATEVRQLAPQILGRLGEVCAADQAPHRLEVRVRV
jgi:predicted nucleic acid-binding Zn ribbon protein